MTGEGTNRYQVLCYEQVHRLHEVMEGTVPVHGRGNFPTLDLKLKDLVQLVRSHLKKEGVTLKDMRLNGGAASYILGCENNMAYNDVDLIFGVDLGGSQSELQKCKAAVLNSLLDLLPEGVAKEKMSTCSLKEAYVQKMVKVCNTHDRWSLISLNNNKGRNIELKFVDTMRRQFEFSVDSFQIILDSLLTFYEISQTPMSEHFYPTMVAESMFGNFNMALYHLNKKLIATRKPEEIRGGGLLKYCNLLVRSYVPAEDMDIKALERYMCSRFFIDFPDIGQQKIKLENYLANHFLGDEDMKYDYLMILYTVVDDSTICLMGHERRQTLNLIQQCASHALMEQEQRAYNKQLALQQFDQQNFQTTFDQQSNLIIDQVYYGPFNGNNYNSNNYNSNYNSNNYNSNGCFPTMPACNINVNNMEQYYPTYATTTTYLPSGTYGCPLCPQYLQCS